MKQIKQRLLKTKKEKAKQEEEEIKRQTIKLTMTTI